ncbi:MAG: hypothetical protein L0H81_03650, partial [Actinomyces sp.]|nr:hypothetical protein [Actinomyces sp.]
RGHRVALTIPGARTGSGHRHRHRMVSTGSYSAGRDVQVGVNGDTAGVPPLPVEWGHNRVRSAAARVSQAPIQ